MKLIIKLSREKQFLRRRVLLTGVNDILFLVKMLVCFYLLVVAKLVKISRNLSP